MGGWVGGMMDGWMDRAGVGLITAGYFNKCV